MRESGGCSALSPKSFGSPGRRVRACRPGGYKSSVEACWPPLTPEHGFPSLQTAYKAQGAPPLPAAALPRKFRFPPPFQKGTKNGRHHKRCLPEKADDSTTSYGGIIRIRCKGRRWFLPLSPSSRAPPVFCCEPIIAPRPRPVNRFWGTESKNQSWPGTLGRRAKLSASSSSVGMVSVILPSWNFS